MARRLILLDTKNWKHFYLKDICEISGVNSFYFNNMTMNLPKVNFISRSSNDNGVVGKVDLIPGIKPYRAGMVTVAMGGSIGKSFVQTDDFYASKSIAVLDFPKEVTLNAKLFICRIIENECMYKYVTFGRELDRYIRVCFDMFLPATENGSPDWSYMDRFIDSLTPWKNKKNILDINLNHRGVLDSVDWSEFRIDDLFNVQKGVNITNKPQVDGEFPYVSATRLNNGVSGLIDERLPNSENTITVNYNGSVGEAFYHPDDYWASSDVIMLHLKSEWGKLNSLSGLFICTVIKQEKYRYSYGRKWTLEYMKKTKIRLPSTDYGRPDWDFMESYIKRLFMEAVSSVCLPILNQR